MNIRDNIIEDFKNDTLNAKSVKQVFKYYNIKKNFEKDAIRAIINSLISECVIVSIDGLLYDIEKTNFLKGKIQGNERGFAFFIPEEQGLGDYFIPAKGLNGAFHNDIVLARKVESTRGSSDEGEVIAIINRGITKLTGTYFAEKTYGFIRPDDRHFSSDIFVAFKDSLNAKTGNKVFAEITSYPKGKNNPEGKVLEVLGENLTLETEELAILKTYGVDQDFPESVLSKAESISKEVLPCDMLGRSNFIDKLTITIDGDYSKDFDDAISLDILKNGNYNLYVHIADVSHYVTHKNPLDKEAFRRATSIYFPDKVCPMLPKSLSNGICSLNEGVSRLCLTCIIEITPNGDVVSSDLVKSVIKSDYRMTYTNVQKMIDGDSEICDKYRAISRLIEDMHSLQQVLSKKRQERGSINLTTKESEIHLNEGKIIIEGRSTNTAHKIIEECMVLANEVVAERIYHLDLPFVYRVHEKPGEEKLKTFTEFAKMLGATIHFSSDNFYSKDFQNLLTKFEDHPAYMVLNRVMLRTMQKAKYSSQNLGHFGLSSKYYCHFTSPIRRYPDLVIHRIIKCMLDGDIGSLQNIYADYVTLASNQSSEREKIADEIERAIDDLYKAYYMLDFVGEEFDGVISGVTSFGVFVELDNTVEGIVRLENLPRGKYEYDEKKFNLKSSHLSLSLGEKVKIGVINVDLTSKKPQFILLKKY